VKNISILPVFFIIVFSLSAINTVFCQDKEQKEKYGLTLGTGFGFSYGQVFELVYSNSWETKNELLSELIWDMKPIFYFGLYADLGLNDIMSRTGFFSSLSFKAGIPADSGVLEDRDWMYPSNSDITRFSSHTNKTDEFFWLDIAVGVSFPVKSFFYIKPFLSGSWMHFAYTGRDGYGIYNDWDPKEVKFSGECITYLQDWLLAAAGFSVGTTILYPFIIDFSFQISPFTYCASTDDHLLIGSVYRDLTSWGLFLEPKGKVSYEYKRLRVSLEFLYRFIGNTKGKSYTNVENTGFYLGPNEAGAGFSVIDTQFLLNFRL
jgi:outer membrane protease